MSGNKNLLIVTGGPGTGKSTIAAHLAASFPWFTALSYDEIKEKEWDRFGFDNAEEKARLNAFSLEEFYLCLQKLMWEGKDILIEYPFNHRHRDRLWQLTHTYGYNCVTVLLEADWRVIYDRFARRAGQHSAAGKRAEGPGAARHPGHQTNHYHIEENALSTAPSCDAVPSFEVFLDDVNAKIYDIRLGHTVRVDVTDFGAVSPEKTAAEIRRWLRVDNGAVGGDLI